MTQKAYKNLEFLNSPAARHIRLLCEYEEPRQRFLNHKVRNTIVMFGSARCKSHEEATEALRVAEAENQAEPTQEGERAVLKAQRGLRLSRYYEDARGLSKKLTTWGMDKNHRYYICSGGGPGIMEAANRGASEVEGGESVALGISLPFEEKVNGYATEDLSFEFHYFFMRKYWFMYLAKAMVVFPGGFGTMDELFELLTLRQTGKVTKPIPTVLFGKEFWEDVVHFEKLAEWGTISAGDTGLFHVADSIEDAYDFLTDELPPT